ncbi:ABC transporter ATP-binding protein [Flavobacterium sp. CS20]|uniref:ABC transporter ATP-binding protein n=1 Tax=Flavobacterium sp. CS20 TaxID=2775246 RepID=UPI001B39E829|nr:ABC transporter ATP-binding protein [Flavobacterium sp. CS20]QTY26021.1 ABC transporter ATP-binding protein [Flavobacterium sp. CS20]
MLLDIQNLKISFSNNTVVSNFSLQLKPSKILGIVGESGSGKSLSVLSILGILPKNAILNFKKLNFDGKDLNFKDKKRLRAIRGREISMIFQEPMSSLNPSMTCGKQVAEVLINHKICRPKVAKTKVIGLFKKVKLPEPQTTFNKYPHQISGGQKQRVMIAMAIACNPKLLIADEPTTALDVSVQKDIIDLLKHLQRETKMSIIFISHDLALVKNIADDIMVMYQGKIVEQATAEQIFNNPQKDYTKALIATRPQVGKRLKKLPTIKDFSEQQFSENIETKTERRRRHEILYRSKPIIKVNALNKSFKIQSSFFEKDVYFKAINNVSFDVYQGEKLGIVGESGCGKTTLGHLITGLLKADSGEIWYDNLDLTQLSAKSLKPIKKDIQIIFQDPYSSLNPRMTIGEAIAEPLRVHRIIKTRKKQKEEVKSLLKAVGLSENHYTRYPHEFSGGQRQRIGIARCLALKPKIIICDESVSALDISVQAQVLNLLGDLKEQFNLTYLFISHDLSVVKQFSDRILVMKNGKVIERGEADEVYLNPKKTYTRKLIEAVPV